MWGLHDLCLLGEKMYMPQMSGDNFVGFSIFEVHELNSGHPSWAANASSPPEPSCHPTHFWPFFFLFETESIYVSQVYLKIQILLPTSWVLDL